MRKKDRNPRLLVPDRDRPSAQYLNHFISQETWEQGHPKVSLWACPIAGDSAMPATALFRVATGRRYQTQSLPTQGLSDEGQEGLGSINISVSLFQTLLCLLGSCSFQYRLVS